MEKKKNSTPGVDGVVSGKKQIEGIFVNNQGMF
jgi:hypothetical protein